MKYNYYKTDGTKEIIETKKPMSLDLLQHLVGGSIELVRLKNGNELFVNEEGAIKSLPRNPHFTQEDVSVDLSHMGNRLLGNIIEGRTDGEGEFIGID